jgi:GH43 family beta-xylosidase
MRKRDLLSRALIGAALCWSAGSAGAQEAGPEPMAGAYINPLLPSGPDPWITQVDGTYYYMHTQRDRITLFRTNNIADLHNAEQKVVWTPPKEGPNAHLIWAPELHRIGKSWFLYYTATASGFSDDAHRAVFVLENKASDPLSGSWIDRGRVNTAHAGIDGTSFAYRGKRYFVYSPYLGPDSGLAIAEMQNPWTLKGKEQVIAMPDQPWERLDGRQILEGPEFLPGPKGDLFLTYSASPCWSDDYALGLLRAAPGANPLDPKAWSKAPSPVLHKGNGVYATGHNGFFKSPDGKEDWIIYHANSAAGMKCTLKRAPHIQKFGWTADGRPDFGLPVPEGVPQKVPSGTK